MIITRAPLSLNFIGDTRFTNKAISSTIDKYFYVAINHTPLINKISAKYSISESAPTLSEIKNTRVRDALKAFGIKSNIEIGMFASFPSKVGLGSSQSFTAALVKGLSIYQGESIKKNELVGMINKVESKQSNSKINKQLVYSTVFGGLLNTTFSNKKNIHKPIHLDFKKQFALEDHFLMYYLGDQKDLKTKKPSKITAKNIKSNSIELNNLTEDFKDALLLGDIDQLAEMLSYIWKLEIDLGISANSSIINTYYQLALKNGAWGGKFLGDYRGGCLLLIVPPVKRSVVKKNIAKIISKNNHSNVSEIDLQMVQSGTEILFSNNNI